MITNKTKLSGNRLYYIWNNIKTRCYNIKSKDYKNYGGRGISMCDDWRTSSKTFCEWAKSNGYVDGMTIERIDNNGNYCPENCTWIPKSEQVNNRRNCLLYTYNNKTQNLAQWCNELGLDYKRTFDRIRNKGWTFERAISTPVYVSKRNKKARLYNGRIYQE